MTGLLLIETIQILWSCFLFLCRKEILRLQKAFSSYAKKMLSSFDISSDKIAIAHAGAHLFLERNGVDLELGKVLIELDRKQAFDRCFVLNGPGGFTNLRVGTLALNLLKTLKGDQLSFFSLSKTELYRAWYQKGRIGRWGAVYIGQKSNVWLWDFEENKLLALVKKAEL